jgi:hypothetical protein
MGGTARTDGKIHIGQGFRGKSVPSAEIRKDAEISKGIGIGACAQGFSKNVKGCPPKATDIIDALS